MPMLFVSNLPASVIVRTFEPIMVGFLVLSTLVMLGISTIVMKIALRAYRSASS